MRLAERLSGTARLVAEHLDVIVARPDGERVPEAFLRRGWDAYLLGLDDAAVASGELGGLAGLVADCGDAPATLKELAARAAEVVVLPRLGPGRASEPPGWRRASLRKQQQVQALVGAVRAHPRLGQARRILDIGSGHGHLTRELAAALRVPAVALEVSPERVAVARRLTSSPEVRHLNVDALDELPPLQPGDLGVGLHACGELGDHLVQQAAQAALPVALVSCCAQKRREAVRMPLSVVPGVAAADLELPREALGLANLLPRAEGVERPLTENIEARERRAALLELLLLCGCEVQPGEEMRGLNRRRAHGSLEALGGQALAQRGLPAPTAAELALAAERGRVRHQRWRRLTLARTALGRVLEVYLLLDRARCLELAGHEVQLGELFDLAVSPRNLALLAHPAD